MSKRLHSLTRTMSAVPFRQDISPFFLFSVLQNKTSNCHQLVNITPRIGGIYKKHILTEYKRKFVRFLSVCRQLAASEFCTSFHANMANTVQTGITIIYCTVPVTTYSFMCSYYEVDNLSENHFIKYYISLYTYNLAVFQQ